MAPRDREVRCLPYEFLWMQSIVGALWAAQLPRSCELLHPAYLLSFPAPDICALCFLCAFRVDR